MNPIDAPTPTPPALAHAQRRALLAGLGGLAAGALVASRAHAGPLDPPPGPVAPTGRTLTEVEPRIPLGPTTTPGDNTAVYRITQPGSYYLTENLTGQAGRNGIVIDADHVTLDLRGFAVAGVPGAIEGIVTPTLRRNLTINDGTIRGWPGIGVNLGASAAVLIRGLHADQNAAGGIEVGSGSCVRECTATQNGGSGIVVGDGSTVLECAASFNSGGSGFRLGARSAASHCAALVNGSHGFSVREACSVLNCAASSNGGSGFNTTNGATLAHCTANQNSADGITCASACVVSECAAFFNSLDGIRVTTRCMVLNNTSINNAPGAAVGAGVHATGSDNVIRGNHCIANDFGIDADASGNLITGNACSNNTTDWSLVANNAIGPILDRRAPASPAVSGFAAASSLGTTDPHANFSF
ncbi:MAG: right-handed parallel beta-helix repeat-containing protein [Phycisphaeraceae bacterium]|nr:MAG: right-handed parallel beta-helix repeat-containing protein [Phycisphaeraceae bacterium]